MPSSVFLAFAVLLLGVVGGLLSTKEQHSGPISEEIYSHANEWLSTGLNELVETARDEVTFFGTNFHITTGDNKPLLLSALRRGVDLRFVFVSPESGTSESKNALKYAAEVVGQTFETTNRQCKTTKDELMGLARQLKAAKKASPDSAPAYGSLTAYTLNSVAPFRAYIADPRSTRGYSYFVPYFFGGNSANTPGFLLPNIAMELTPHCIAAVDKAIKTPNAVKFIDE